MRRAGVTFWRLCYLRLADARSPGELAEIVVVPSSDHLHSQFVLGAALRCRCDHCRLRACHAAQH